MQQMLLPKYLKGFSVQITPPYLLFSVSSMRMPIILGKINCDEVFGNGQFSNEKIPTHGKY